MEVHPPLLPARPCRGPSFSAPWTDGHGRYGGPLQQRDLLHLLLSAQGVRVGISPILGRRCQSIFKDTHLPLQRGTSERAKILPCLHGPPGGDLSVHSLVQGEPLEAEEDRRRSAEALDYRCREYGQNCSD